VIHSGAGNDTLNAGGGNDLLDGGAGADTMTGGAGNDTYYVDDPADVINEGAGGGYDTVIFTVGGSLTQPANVEKIIFMESVTLPSLVIGPGGVVILGAGSVPASPPASGSAGAMLAADSGLTEIARLQAVAGTPAVQLPIENTITALAEITASAAHDTAVDIAITNPVPPFPELFAPESITDADPTHDIWHHEPALAPLDFDVIDAIV
jgi:hypothetical protein